jgi:hypothetical protein
MFACPAYQDSIVLIVRNGLACRLEHYSKESKQLLKKVLDFEVS